MLKTEILESKEISCPSAVEKRLEIDQQYRSFPCLIFPRNFVKINRCMFRIPFKTSFTLVRYFWLKRWFYPFLSSSLSLSFSLEYISISRFIRICLEIDRPSAMHADSPFPDTSGEISVFLIAFHAERAVRRPSKSFIESCESIAALSFRRLLTRSSSRGSMFEISNQTLYRISAETSLTGNACKFLAKKSTRFLYLISTIMIIRKKQDWKQYRYKLNILKKAQI